MKTKCGRCGNELSALWSVCPQCGAAARHEFSALRRARTAVRGGFGGMVFGFILAPVLIFPGILLCLLGWGIVLGVPMIVLGIMAPLAAPVLGLSEHLGRCPSCGVRVLGVTDGKVHGCPVCNAKFDIEHNRLMKA